MTYTQFLNEIGQQRFRPAYLFTGKEEYLIEEGVKKLVEKLLAPEDRDLNYTVIYGKESDNLPETILSAPIFGGRKVTVVKQAEKVAGRGLDAITRYLQNPPKDGVLIMWMQIEEKKLKAARTKDPLNSKKFHIRIPPLVPPIICKQLSPNELATWMENHVKQYDKKITGEAQAQLSAINWPSLHELASEINQLALLVGDKKTIRPQDIRELGGGSFAFERYTLSDALGTGNRKLAQEALQRMHLMQLAPTQIIGDMFRLFHHLWVLRWYVDAKKEHLARETIKLHPWVLQNYIRYARRLRLSRLETGILWINEADLNIKRGIRNGNLEVQVLIGRLIRLTCK